MSIEAIFNLGATAYDRDRRVLIPCYDDFYSTAVDVVPYHSERELRILDIGAGTGILSEKFAAKYVRSQLTLVDISANMLDMADQRLSQKFPGRVSFTLMDYAKAPFTGNFDLVVSALSIHHLSDEAKSQLFQKIHRHLEPGGFFVNCDQVRGENDFAQKCFKHKWLLQVRENGVSEQVLQQTLDRMQKDKMSPLSSQLRWLDEAGFEDITTWYKNYSFVVFSGTKKL